MIINDYTISEFRGLNTSIKDLKTLGKGVSPDSLNWITGRFSDNIQLRRGQALLGQTRQTGNGKITGMGIGLRYDGVQVPFYSYLRKLNYYNSATNDTVEISTDILPVLASGEDLWIIPYQNLAGSFVYAGSQNSSIYKIHVANPANAVNQSVGSYRFSQFKVNQGRGFGVQRKGDTAGNNDNTGVYNSYVDKALLSSYTQTTAEAYGTGNGVTKTFAYTLVNITGKNTAMYPSVTDTVETFTDDRNGGMVGNLGGTGTINYATGAVSVTFNTAPANLQAITCSYYREDSTSTGILDFSGSTFGQGGVFRQDDGGGNAMALLPINNVEYCFHLLKTWQLTMATNSTEISTNLPYRNIGIPYPFATFQTPEGIIFVDISRPTEPKFRRLQVSPNTTNLTIEPLSISDALDLTPYEHDYSVAFPWGEYETFCVQEKVNGTANTFNSIMFIRNVLSNTWDKLDYYASRLGEYNGTLIAGDSISNNVFTLFSGYDDDGDIIKNYWTNGEMNLGTDRQKTCRRMDIQGLIQSSQRFKVSLAYDGGDFSDVYTVLGNGSYVDAGTNIYVGASTIGSAVIGGGGGDTAHPFQIDLPINSDRFETVRVRFEALDVGFLQINEFSFRDIRDKGQKKIPTHTI